MAVKDLIAKGYGGYAGWGDAEADADFRATGGQGKYTGAPQQSQPQVTAGVSYQATPSQNTQNRQPSSAQDLINMGYYGYQGWGDAEAVADFKATGGQGKGGPQSSSGAGLGSVMSTTPTINLPELYKSLTESSGVKALEEDYFKKEQELNKNISLINDNPFLSEANRVGRIQKIQTDFNNATATQQRQIESRKADIETQLNLQTKQFDINSQQAQLALSQFNSLLDSGALNTANDEDIANMTRATGLSSNIIRSAINNKIQAGYATEIQSFDDGVDEGFVIYTIDPLGNIVNQTKQVTGKSTKAKSLGMYSTDPVVSSFLSQYLNRQTNISDLWEGIY